MPTVLGTKKNANKQDARKMINKRISTVVGLGIIVLLLLIVAGGIYWVGSGQGDSMPLPPSTEEMEESLPAEVNDNRGKYKLAIVELVNTAEEPGVLHYCSNGKISHTAANDPNLSAEPGCTSLASYNYFQILNNPQKQFTQYVTGMEDTVGITNPRSFYYLNDYYENEAKKYGVSDPINFEIDIKGPITVSACPEIGGTLNYGELTHQPNLISRDYLADKIARAGVTYEQYDYVAVVYIDRYGRENGCTRPAGQSFADVPLVFIALDSRDLGNEYHLLSLAHELLHQFGAADKYVRGGSSGVEWCNMILCPSYPDGVPNPAQYPQTSACIMGPDGTIMTEKGTGISSHNMDQVVICRKTAQEIGWVK